MGEEKRQLEVVRELLGRPGVHIRDEAGLVAKILKMKEAGADKLHIVADFDRTLSSNLGKDGKPGATSHQAVIKEVLPEEGWKKAEAYQKHYYPIEQDQSIPAEKRAEFMVEWWSKTQQQYVDASPTFDELREAVRRCNIKLRAGGLDLFQLAEKANVPVSVCSAGLGDVIKFSFEENEMMLPNVTVHANWFTATEEGRIGGYSHPIIHSLNKGESTLGNSQEMEKRGSILLLGDMLSDLDMTKKLKKDIVLGMGFLNAPEPTQQAMEMYCEAFDIVMTGDGSLEHVRSVFEALMA